MRISMGKSRFKGHTARAGVRNKRGSCIATEKSDVKTSLRLVESESRTLQIPDALGGGEAPGPRLPAAFVAERPPIRRAQQFERRRAQPMCQSPGTGRLEGIEDPRQFRDLGIA